MPGRPGGESKDMEEQRRLPEAQLWVCGSDKRGDRIIIAICGMSINLILHRRALRQAFRDGEW